MDIFLHNTLSGKKEKFTPIEPGKVSMYNCGPTVYDYSHIGNLRSYVFADVLRRMFEYNDYKVKQIINITDIGHLTSDGDEGEDKMTKALKRESKPLTLKAMREVADFYFAKFKKDLISLNIESPEQFPFASDNITEDIALITKLTEKGFTYRTSDGIYFDTSKFADYGKLGNIMQIKDGQSRIGINPEKRNSRDFAVWKFNAELGYDTPFGKGFPGWHIECSAMSVKYLGPEFDIHTGGIDHIPVHHNNEIAQSVCAGYPYARYWMHNAFLILESGNKMSKSRENFTPLKILKEKDIDPLAYRYLLLTAHYSSPLQFSWEAVEGAQVAWKRLKTFMSKSPFDTVQGGTLYSSPMSDIGEEYRKKFWIYINNDLDTPQALALVWEIVKDDKISEKDKRDLILDFDKVLGLKLDEGMSRMPLDIPEHIQNLIAERDKSRAEKDFVKSDELRAEIESLGFEVMDTGEGTRVEKK